jgi:hypothetical protein
MSDESLMDKLKRWAGGMTTKDFAEELGALSRKAEEGDSDALSAVKKVAEILSGRAKS